MFRLNDPDAYLTFLLVASAAALWAALESGRTRWLVLCGSLIGVAFITKMLEAFIVLPAFGLVYLICADNPLRRRVFYFAVERRDYVGELWIVEASGSLPLKGRVSRAAGLVPAG